MLYKYISIFSHKCIHGDLWADGSACKQIRRAKWAGMGFADCKVSADFGMEGGCLALAAIETCKGERRVKNALGLGSSFGGGILAKAGAQSLTGLSVSASCPVRIGI